VTDSDQIGPLLTAPVYEKLRTGAGGGAMECSLDLDRSLTTVDAGVSVWSWRGRHYPYPEACKERTIYHWSGDSFQPVARYSRSLIKLIPTQWGAPTFEIDGIKMLPTSKISPFTDAERKVALIQPRGKAILDTCGGLGYFAAWCLEGGATAIDSYEKNPDVLWLRSLNPWSPEAGGRLALAEADVAERIVGLADGSFDAVLHDPPRFGIAGELYSQVFYEHLFRVLRRRGRLFHYTGTPNRLTSGRDVPGEVASRLRRAGFATESRGDGVLAVKQSGHQRG
jgi:predicted methyltransferase